MASSALTCTICYESYVESTDICSTKCGHIFHMSCLQQWITQCNKCPMCNENYPQPHRIYLDIALVKEPQENDRRENIVVVKGIKPNQVTTPLNSLIQKLVVVMQVPITDKDIKDIIKRGHKEDLAVHVMFKTKYYMDLFLKQKHKLKKNPETSQIRVYELLNTEIAALFQYTHKLKKADYEIFYVENEKVYVKKNKNSQPINILTKDQVDDLCAQHTNHCKKASTEQAHQKTKVRFTNNFQRAPDNLNISEETQELFRYSQPLIAYGYNVFIESNNVFVSKNSKNSPNRIAVSYKRIIDDLLYIEERGVRDIYPYRPPPSLGCPNNETTCNIL